MGKSCVVGEVVRIMCQYIWWRCSVRGGIAEVLARCKGAQVWASAACSWSPQELIIRWPKKVSKGGIEARLCIPCTPIKHQLGAMLDSDYVAQWYAHLNSRYIKVLSDLK